MSFKQSLVTASILSEINHDKKSRQMKNSSKSSPCKVCGDKASIINYGALSCQSCKTFFRRNGFHRERIRPCLFNRSCKIDLNTRRTCAACRLEKCLSVNMSVDFIRKKIDQNKKYLSKKNIHSDQNVIDKQVMYLQQLPILTRLSDDQLVLNKSEWTLISNVVHAHDQFSTIPQMHRCIENLFELLSINMSDTVLNVFKFIAFMYTSMYSFISSSPDFRILTINEQYSLFERNLHGVIALDSILFFCTSGIIDNPKCMKTFETIYTLEIVHQAKRINKQLDSDLIIVKMMLIILAFSSNCFIIHKKENFHNDELSNGIFRLFGSQNVYVELLWKYMFYRYGYCEAAIRFSRLIEICLDVIKYATIFYTSNETHHYLVNIVFEQIKQLLMTDQNKHGPLWGKTK